MKTFLKTQGFPEILAKWAQEQIANTRNGGTICQILIWGFAIPSRQSPREKKNQTKNKELQRFACLEDRELDDVVDGTFKQIRQIMQSNAK